MIAGLSTASISDSSGNLLFYSHGGRIYNRTHSLMPNGIGLFGTSSFGQPVFAVKNLVDDSLYYLFTVDERLFPFYGQTYGLRYSLIDMRLDDRKGDIVPGQKNLKVYCASKASSGLTGIRHQNNKDVWIVVRLYQPDSNSYAAYLIDTAGIDTIPVLSDSQIILTELANSPTCQVLKFSQDGHRFVCAYSNRNNINIIEFCSFNTNSGIITPMFTFNPSLGNYGPYVPESLEFSIDAKFLYVSATALGLNPGHSVLFQYDATKLDSLQFKQTETIIGINRISGIQLGPDWKIYGTEYPTPLTDSLCTIDNPSLQGLACDYQINSIGLNGNFSYRGLPQLLQRYKAYIHYLGDCQFDSVQFWGDIHPPPDSLHWDFGDPTSGSLNFSNDTTPFHVYSLPGQYTVELFVRHIDNRTDTSWKTITIYPKPVPVLGPDRTICAGNSTTFDAGSCAGCNFEWKDITSGLTVGTNQTYTTNLSGNYSVIVTNTNGCSGRDTVQLFTTPVPQLTNNPLYDSICSGETTNIPLTSTPSSSIFNWTTTLTSGTITGFSVDSGLVIQQTLVNTGITAGVVTYHITPKIGSCSGNTVDFPVTVIVGDSVKVSITATQNSICAGTSVTFTATPINGGTNPVYQWKVNSINSGTNSPVFTYSPNNGDVVQCILTSSNTVCTSNNPASSNTISMVVYPNLPVSVSVSPSQNPVCSGASVTFTATLTNGGTTPSFQWKVNGINVGTNNPSYSYTPINNDIVTCVLTSSETCTSGNPASSNIVTLTVNPLLPVTVSISPSSNPFCIGNSVTFTATPTNGGTNPSYQWKVNGVNVGTNSPNYSFNPLNNDSVRCIMTSNLSCVSNNPAGSNKIILSGTLAPVVTFTSCFDTITTLNAKPIKLKGGIPLNGTYSGPGVNSTTGVLTPSTTGIGLKTITYSYTNVSLCSASKNKTILVQSTPSFTCGNNLTDIRDNMVYPTVQIGSQCWMAANLNYGTIVNSPQLQYDNCVSEKYCYNNLNSNCSSYGGLYRWDELMQYDDTPSNQGLCPPGWHIPTEGEWTTLFNFYSGSAFAGKPLQDSIITGFRALTSGVFYLSTSWNFTGFATLFWSSTAWGATKALSHGMNTYNYSVSLYPSSRANSFPVRCLKD